MFSRINCVWFIATVQVCDRTNNIRFMTKLNVFYTIWFWSSLVCKLIFNKGFLWSGCCVCEHTLNFVMFVHTHTQSCGVPSLVFFLYFHFKIFYLVFAMVCDFYIILLPCISHHFCIAYILYLSFFNYKEYRLQKIQWHGHYK
jgi:hypothetical protein